MTDYHARPQIGTKTKSGQGRWKAIFVIFIGITLFFAVFNGFAKSKKSAENIKKNGWDGISSFVVVVNGAHDYLAIFQREPKRVIAFKLGDLIGDGADMGEVTKAVSTDAGTAVKNYLAIQDGLDLFDTFGEFTSPLTPVKIVFGGWDNVNTNISRVEALRLWWQAKGIRVQDVEEADVISNLDDNRDDRVMGVASDDFDWAVKPYVENLKILSEDIDIVLVNQSAEPAAGQIMEAFIDSTGARVVEIMGGVDVTRRCQIEGGESYTRNYLAKAFDCDIKDKGFDGSGHDILTVIIGQEFASTFL